MPHNKKNKIKRVPVEHQQLKSEFIINPITGNIIKKGSRTYMQLLKDNILKIPHEQRKQKIIYDGPHVQEIKENFKTDDNHRTVMKNGKLFKQTRKLDMMEYIDHTIDVAVDLIRNDLDDININDMTNDEIDEKIRELLNQKLIE